MRLLDLLGGSLFRFLPLEAHHEVFNRLLVNFLDGSFVEIDWDEPGLDYFRVLEEHIQEHLDFKATLAHEVAVQLAEPLLAWEIREAR